MMRPSTLKGLKRVSVFGSTTLKGLNSKARGATPGTMTPKQTLRPS